MPDKYYIFEDSANSIATVLRTNPTNPKVWLEEMCNVAEVSEEKDNGNCRSYLLSYCDRKGGIRITIDDSGTPILCAMDNRVVRQISVDEVLNYQGKWLRNPAETPKNS
ncbi:MAG: hypothetical protein AABX17_04220 [Nanoarchaeota archaeon]